MTLEDSPSPRRALERAVWLLAAIVVILWLVELIDVVVLDDRLEGQGIRPRTWDGLDGVLWAPFLHDGFRHLLANTLPLIVLGGLVLLQGFRTWALVTAGIVVGGGLATWLLARNANHIGASGVVFGYVGYLIGAAWFERSLRAIAVAVAVLALYGGGLLIGLLPRPGISWEGHLFGALAGVAMAGWMAPRGRDESA